MLDTESNATNNDETVSFEMPKLKLLPPGVSSIPDSFLNEDATYESLVSLVVNVMRLCLRCMCTMFCVCVCVLGVTLDTQKKKKNSKNIKKKHKKK